MPKMGDELQKAIYFMGQKVRLPSLASKLTDRQLANAIAVLTTEREKREKEKANQEAMREQREAFLASIKEQAAALDITGLSYIDEHTGEQIGIHTKAKRAPSAPSSQKRQYAPSYFIADKEGYHRPSRGARKMPRIFAYGGMTDKNREKFKAQHVHIINKVFSKTLRNDPKVLPPSELPNSLKKLKTLSAQGKKNAARLMKLIEKEDTE